MHAAGKTEEARADLARLAIIRKQREDAAKKRDEDKKGKIKVSIFWEVREIVKKKSPTCKIWQTKLLQHFETPEMCVA